ncbi:hypothetical protein [Flaviaesturariibacter amylovorans]|uniref:Glycosyltransferase family 1 protein n=1 Tax=Flaviaesturariibacter amylovorans TaxID=1084520 RepID=A0ABP8GRS3_9BACT
MDSLSRLLFKVKRKLKKKLRDVELFRAYLSRRGRTPRPAPGQKAVWIDLHDNSYVRYLYILVKYFQAEGYQVYLSENPRFLLSLGDDYSRFLIEEEFVRFSSKVPEGAIAFTDRVSNSRVRRKLSNDYFLHTPDTGSHRYHVPIGMHPHMYKYGWWNAPYDESQRKRSVFFAGNFDPNDYKIFSSSRKFKMIDRLELQKQLLTMEQTRFPKSFDELKGGAKHGSIDIVDKGNFVVEQSDLRSVIANYSFFIACPGVFMPQSHNVYEAMSVGTVPIIHEEYAQLFAPALEHGRNAVLYNNDNFTERLQEALTYPEEKVNELVRNVKTYYEHHLSPKAIVAALSSDQYREVYLNAEKTSIRKLNARKEGPGENSLGKAA